MSRAEILRALASGPHTSAQLAAVTGHCSAYIARDCNALTKLGRIKRIDGGSGRGKIATYALAGHDLAAAPPPPPPRKYSKVLRADQPQRPVPHPGQIVSRDPCPKCGVRGDLGCRHSAAQVAQ